MQNWDGKGNPTVEKEIEILQVAELSREFSSPELFIHYGDLSKTLVSKMISDSLKQTKEIGKTSIRRRSQVPWSHSLAWERLKPDYLRANIKEGVWRQREDPSKCSISYK